MGRVSATEDLLFSDSTVRSKSPLRQAVIHVGETGERPGENGQNKEVQPGSASGHDAADVFVRHEDAVQNRVVAPGGPHAHHVPGLLDGVALGIARQEGVNHLGRLGIAGVHAVKPEIRPYRSQTAERFATGELVSALDPFRFRHREENRDVVAGLCVACGEDRAGSSLLQYPLQGAVPGAVELRGHSGPVDVHVAGQSRCRSVVGESPGLPADLGQVHSLATLLLGHGHQEVAGFLELLEVFG